MHGNIVQTISFIMDLFWFKVLWLTGVCVCVSEVRPAVSALITVTSERVHHMLVISADHKHFHSSRTLRCLYEYNTRENN